MRIFFLIIVLLSFNSYSEEITLREIEIGGLSEGMALACFGMYQTNNDFDELAPYSKIRNIVRATRSMLNKTQRKLWGEYKNKAFNNFNDMSLVKKIESCDNLKKYYPSSTKLN